jgi:hypothetical protein
LPYDLNIFAQQVALQDSGWRIARIDLIDKKRALFTIGCNKPRIAILGELLELDIRSQQGAVAHGRPGML